MARCNHYNINCITGVCYGCGMSRTEIAAAGERVSAPWAELEALEFADPVDAIRSIAIAPGEAVWFRRKPLGDDCQLTWILQHQNVWFYDYDVPRIHAELVALRDSGKQAERLQAQWSNCPCESCGDRETQTVRCIFLDCEQHFLCEECRVRANGNGWKTLDSARKQLPLVPSADLAALQTELGKMAGEIRGSGFDWSAGRDPYAASARADSMCLSYAENALNDLHNALSNARASVTGGRLIYETHEVPESLADAKRQMLPLLDELRKLLGRLP